MAQARSHHSSILSPSSTPSVSSEGFREDVALELGQGAGVGVLFENCCDAGVGVILPLCDDAGVLARLTGAGVWPWTYPIPNSQPGVAAGTKPGFGVSDWRLQFGDHGVCSWLREETELPRKFDCT